MNTGYFPGVASIGDRIVYIENRDGNANVKTAQSETLKRAYQLLKDNQIYINRSRMDAGSYSEEIIKTVADYSRLFYIRANKCEALTQEILQITNRQGVEINFKNYQLASIPFTNFLRERNFRLVIMREKTDDLQFDLFEGGKFNYRCIPTNDWASTEKDVIEYYNGRGNISKYFLIFVLVYLLFIKIMFACCFLRKLNYPIFSLSNYLNRDFNYFINN